MREAQAANVIKEKKVIFYKDRPILAREESCLSAGYLRLKLRCNGQEYYSDTMTKDGQFMAKRE
jgi:hypothetical protein